MRSTRQEPEVLGRVSRGNQEKREVESQRDLERSYSFGDLRSLEWLVNARGQSQVTGCE